MADIDHVITLLAEIIQPNCDPEWVMQMRELFPEPTADGRMDYCFSWLRSPGLRETAGTALGGHTTAEELHRKMHEATRGMEVRFWCCRTGWQEAGMSNEQCATISGAFLVTDARHDLDVDQDRVHKYRIRDKNVYTFDESRTSFMLSMLPNPRNTQLVRYHTPAQVWHMYQEILHALPEQEPIGTYLPIAERGLDATTFGRLLAQHANQRGSGMSEALTDLADNAIWVNQYGDRSYGLLAVRAFAQCPPECRMLVPRCFVPYWNLMNKRAKSARS